MILRNFDELIGVAKVRGRRRLAVARAEDRLVLEGLRLAWNEELIEPVLFGNADRIREWLLELDLPEDWRVENVAGDDRACARRAVAAVKAGEAELLVKGHLQTAELFKAVLDKEHGLPRKGILSHMAFVSIDHYPKLFGTTDGGLNLAPDFEQKCAIVRNAVEVFQRLGYARPKIGLLSYVEKVRPGDPETGDWRQIEEMAAEGRFGEADIEGPLAMDLCLSRDAKSVKHVESAVAADVDVIVAPTITACNASTKALLLQGGQGAGLVVGASAPIVSLSRGDNPRTRLCSIAAGIAMLEQGAR